MGLQDLLQPSSGQDIPQLTAWMYKLSFFTPLLLDTDVGADPSSLSRAFMVEILRKEGWG